MAGRVVRISSLVVWSLVVMRSMVTWSGIAFVTAPNTLRKVLSTRLTSKAASSKSSPEPDSVTGRVVILGAGLQGAALAYYLTLRGVKPVIVEREKVAAAASGKGGGFLARDWGDSITRKLHLVSFKLHEELAETLGIESYRRIPVLSVAPGKRSSRTRDICPWLDGDIADSQVMDADGGAQVAPYELCTKLMEAAVSRGAELRIGSAEGVETEPYGDIEHVTGVMVDGAVVPADKVCICLGPWAALAQDWFNMPVPMTGVKSTSIVFKSSEPVEPFALFCGEDPRFGTHLEVYPRNSGEVYLCGIGGSENVDGSRLRRGELLPSQVQADPSRVAAATASFSEMSRRLGGKPDVVQACMRPCPPDALPIMGKVGHVRGAYISAGHNCWGILWAPVSGLAMSELIMDGEASCVDLRHFSPGRFAGMGIDPGGGRGRKKGSVPVGEQW
eukprot:TRINITY_DN35667_c0_g1_i1.p1 TRINITY_DN35667_c0_g1~~TRINITY_DN35667_c0_g1_i1.p1  ORF type:complete len:446 (-),score=69.56 TRINITY_DN35667_c0_g1_i1:226-1563(-)